MGYTTAELDAWADVLDVSNDDDANDRLRGIVAAMEPVTLDLYTLAAKASGASGDLHGLLSSAHEALADAVEHLADLRWAFKAHERGAGA